VLVGSEQDNRSRGRRMHVLFLPRVQKPAVSSTRPLGQGCGRPISARVRRVRRARCALTSLYYQIYRLLLLKGVYEIIFNQKYCRNDLLHSQESYRLHLPCTYCLAFIYSIKMCQRQNLYPAGHLLATETLHCGSFRHHHHRRPINIISNGAAGC
jgi:hypothetical protein